MQPVALPWASPNGKGSLASYRVSLSCPDRVEPELHLPKLFSGHPRWMETDFNDGRSFAGLIPRPLHSGHVLAPTPCPGDVRC